MDWNGKVLLIESGAAVPEETEPGTRIFEKVEG